MAAKKFCHAEGPQSHVVSIKVPLYFVLIASAALMPILIYALIAERIQIFFSSTILFFAVPLIKTVFTKSDGPSLNRVLAKTGMLLFLYSLIFSFGWLYADLRL